MSQINFVNCTHHPLAIHGDRGVMELAPSGIVPRLAQTTSVVYIVNGFKVSRSTLGEIEGLPAPETGTVYIVSWLVAQAAKRDDVMAPGAAIRDDDGRVIGAAGFSIP